MATFEPEETADNEAGATKPARGLRALVARSIYNARTPIRIAVGRQARRPAFYPDFPWGRWALACVVIAVACLFLLDPAIGRTEHQWPPAFVATADVFTRIGLGVWYVVPPLLWLCFANLVDWRALSRRRLIMFYNWSSLAFFMIIAVASSGLTSVLLKTVIGRARPLNYDQLGVLSFHPFMLDARFASFPSGHATVVGTVATLLVLLFPRWKYLVFPFAIWIASTRIFVGAHYPSDTVIGLGLGAGCTLALALIFARLGFIFVQRPNALPVRRDTFWIFGLPERQKRPSPATPSNAGHRPE